MIAVPEVVSPVPHTKVSAGLGFIITLLPMVMSHRSTDFEIRTAPNGEGGPVWTRNVKSALQLVMVPEGQLSGLEADQTYYIRARFLGRDGSEGEWSKDQRITT